MELDVTAAISGTPLADHLTASGEVVSADLVPYLGSLTVQRFDVAEAETDALLAGASVHDLGWLRRIGLRGEDRFRWLSGMVTNGVDSLAENAGAYNLVLNAQGRIQGDCYVWRDGEKLEIEVTAEQADALLAHFDKFIIMDDVELFAVEGVAALGLTGPEAARVLSALGAEPLPEELTSAPALLKTAQGEIVVRIDRGFGTVDPHYAVWAAVEAIPSLWQAAIAAGAVAVGSQAIETLRVVEGIPAYGVDIQSRDLAQETGQDRALSFTKGCYLGQEIVERIRSRGQVHRHLRALELFIEDSIELPANGIEFQGASKTAGNLASVAALRLNGRRRIFAIGMIRAEAEVGGRPLAFEGGTAQILTSPPNFKI
jgi:folate-binding protein YgfZ